MTPLATHPTGPVSGLLRALTAFRAEVSRRRALTQLLQLSDWQLNDIGLSRGAVERSLEAPMWRRAQVWLLSACLGHEQRLGTLIPHNQMAENTGHFVRC
ncbi:MAG: DUF1127 domain-containing protein [Pseudomonadota bacterium]